MFGQFYSDSDLTAFQQKYNLPAENVTEIVGKNNFKKPTGEAELDVQYGKAIARNIPTIFWSHNGTYLEWITNVSNRQNTPLVWSVSYNLGDEGDYSAANRQALDIAFQKLALRGVSLLFASGDEGTGRTGTFGCGTFNPGYPAASPYITSVGGTYINTLLAEEIGWGDSGGGFSFAYNVPDYQKDKVTKYLSNQGSKLPSSKIFNSKGRGYPDISALSTNYDILVTGTAFNITGTSGNQI